METYIISLEAVGQCQESYGNLLVPVVLEKMPADICRQLARENNATKLKLGDLRLVINREIGIFEDGTPHSDSGIDNYLATASFAQPDRRQFYAGKDPRAEMKCSFCEGRHKSSDCSTYIDTDSRLKIVKDKC